MSSLILKGITGENCDQFSISLNPCDSNPCFGESVCINEKNQSFSCICDSDRIGPQCQGHRSPCKCQNGATCSNIEGNSFACICSPGYA